MSFRALQVEGIVPALITPMNMDGSVNVHGLVVVLNHVIEAGVHGVFALGSQGESYALTTDEKKRVIEAVLDIVDGRVPVYVGTGMITTARSVQMTKIARNMGADAVSVITPYFIQPSQDELAEHFMAVAEAAGDMPVLLYNNPKRTAISIDVDTVQKLAAVANIVGMKDSSADLVQTMTYVEATLGMDFSVMVGNDALISASLMAGARGAVAATANVAPSLIVGIYEAVKSGDMDTAQKLQQRLLPLRKAFGLGTFPVVVKEAMNIMGLPAGPARKPIKPLTLQKRRELTEVLLKAGIIE